MQKKFLGVKNILFSIVNKGEKESSDYAIAYYLLEHYQNLKNINIIDMATDCFVDRSTIRRFFHRYGFDNFQEFKQNYSDEFEERYFKDVPFKNYHDYIMDLNHNILCMMNQYALKRDKSEDINQFIDRMYQARTIILMGDESFYGDMDNIQQYMLALGKIVLIITSNVEHHAVLTNVTKEDCIIVLSLKGAYYKTVKDIISYSNCCKMLITRSGKKEWYDDFDYIAQLTSESNQIDDEIYRRYAMTYFIDIMLHTYKMKYRER